MSDRDSNEAGVTEVPPAGQASRPRKARSQQAAAAGDGGTPEGAAVEDAALTGTDAAAQQAGATAHDGEHRPRHGHKHKHHHKRHHAEVAHAVHGRIRLKIPAGVGNLALLEQMRAAFLKHPGIAAVTIKPHTGSLVIEYDAEHHPDVASLFASIDHHEAHPDIPKVATSPHHRPPKTELDEKLDAFEEEAEFLAEHSHLARSIVDAVKSLDRTIKRITRNNLDLKIVAPVGLAGFTFLEIGAAAATPMWVTLVIFSMNHFVEMRAHVSGEEEEAAAASAGAQPAAPPASPRG